MYLPCFEAVRGDTSKAAYLLHQCCRRAYDRQAEKGGKRPYRGNLGLAMQSDVALSYYSGNAKGGAAKWLDLLREGGLPPGRVSAGI